MFAAAFDDDDEDDDDDELDDEVFSRAFKQNNENKSDKRRESEKEKGVRVDERHRQALRDWLHQAHWTDCSNPIYIEIFVFFIIKNSEFRIFQYNNIITTAINVATVAVSTKITMD